MLREVLAVERCIFWDRDPARAGQVAAELQGEAVQQLAPAAHSADVIVTCTTSTEPFLHVGMVRPGAFIAAVGTDNPRKSEIAPALMASSTVVTDVTDQCVEMGDLHHAIDAGLMGAAEVHAELAQLLAGEVVGRTADDEIIIFDSTGTGLQDVTSAAAIYERCAGDGSILSVALSAL
jgi:ornithine cyclodeaminase/alanine dehydrogenase-like protein (mu-crystallin family)